MKRGYVKSAVLLAATLTSGFVASANTVSMTFVGTNTGVSDGSSHVLPYQIKVNGLPMNGICYDIFDGVSVGQIWIANAFTVAQAAAIGEFGGYPDALADYSEIGFLSQQATHSAQNQIDLQHDIWNVFAPGTYALTSGMQTYLNLLTTPAFTNFDFSTVLFLEDANQGAGRRQAFVISVVTTSVAPTVPEPGTMTMAIAGIAIAVMARRRWIDVAGLIG